MKEGDGNDEAHFAALHEQLRAAQTKLAGAHARRHTLADAVTRAELHGAVAPIGLLADLNEAERALGPVEDDVLDAECALIMAGAHSPDDEPNTDQRF